MTLIKAYSPLSILNIIDEVYMPKKTNFTTIQDFFKTTKCTLLTIIDDYQSSKTKLKFICSCGVIFYKTFYDFKLKPKCKKCSLKEGRNKIAFTLEYIKSEFNNRKCTLLAIEYINSNTPMEYICSCGNYSKISWHNLQSDHKCRICGSEERNKKRRNDINKIKEYFIEQKCIPLFDSYRNSREKLKYICICGKIGFTNWHDFRKGIRCGCGKSRGELRVTNYLLFNNINFKPQKRFDDCRYKNPLPFDFYIEDKNILIEFDGQQHYKVTRFDNISDKRAEDNLLYTKLCDTIKTQYCLDNNIKLIRIPYWDLKNIEIILDKNLDLNL
jgi:hypothetical protein